MKRRLLFFVIAVFAVSGIAHGQVKPVPAAPPPTLELIANDAPRVQTLRFDSTLMGRKMPVRVIVPARYNERSETGRRYPVVFLLHGLSGHFDNWTQRTKVVEYSERFNRIIVMAEGDDGWYTDSATKPSDKYESYIVKELVPAIEVEFRVLPGRENRAIAGLSMGGYGSIKFGLKYPDMFALVGSFSGALGAASFTEKNAGKNGRTVDVVYGAEGSETRKANDIFELVRSLTPEKKAALPFIYLDCGTEDRLFKSNRDFADLLLEAKVPHEFRELPGTHSWKFWDSQVLEFLRVADRILGS